MRPVDAVLFWWCALLMHVRCEYVCYELVFLVMWTTLLVLRPTQAHRARLVGKDASLTQSPPTHPSRRRRHFLPLAFVPLTSPHAATHATPLRWDARHTMLGATHTTPLTARSGGGGKTQQRRRWRRRLEEGSSDDDDYLEEEEGSSHEVDARMRTWRQAGSDEE
jgi:hypothetical protein